MGYYFDHQEEIDLEITQEWDQIQVTITRIAKSPFYTGMKEVSDFFSAFPPNAARN